MAARKRAGLTRIVVAPPPGKPETLPPDQFWHSILTDHNGDFDLGAVLVGVVVCAMCAISGYQGIVIHIAFNALEFGGGIGAVLAGFAAYKWGDARRTPGVTTTTVQATQTSTEPLKDSR